MLVIKRQMLEKGGSEDDAYMDRCCRRSSKSFVK